MKAAIKAQWLADLRSGDFKQGKGALNVVEPDGSHLFCCLGVLCEQAVKAGVIDPPTHDTFANTMRYPDPWPDFPGNTNVGTLPLKVVQWAGLSDLDNPHNPIIARGDVGDDIYAGEANDALDWSFDQIADAIEANIPEDTEDE